MNEHNQTTPPPILGTALALPPAPAAPKPITWWLRKLFACNPFYLVSAALLLYGCYRVSVDAPLFNRETVRLLFNFSVVQLYEVLLVVTAIFLARRAIWYDAKLLASLENLLVFVPFIFISLAALIDSGMALTMCLAGGAVAVARFGSLKRWYTQLHLPGVLLAVGFILLALNIALPLVYRSYGEHIIGAFINSGPEHAMNVRVWMLVLPAAFALANLLPRLTATGALPSQHRWLPFGWFCMWMTVTCLHLYSLGYIYQFDFRAEQVAPALWVLVWTVCFQLNRNFPQSKYGLKYALALPPMLVPLLAAAPDNGNTIFLILTALNLAAYGGLRFYDRNHRLAGHLLYASGLMLVAGLPAAWLHLMLAGLTAGRAVAFGLVAYLLFWTLRLRDPRMAVLGASVLGCAVAGLLQHHANAVPWALQSGFAFVLVHSLRWNDGKHPGAKAVRILTAVVWVAASFFWMNSAEAGFWMPCLTSAMVLASYFTIRILRQCGEHLVVPATSILVMLSGPANATADGMLALPIGLLAVFGSFVLFGIGTVAALTRRHWQQNEHCPEAEAANAAHPES